MKVSPKEKPIAIFVKNFIGGIGWVTGATIGFAVLISLLTLIFNRLGGLPFVGKFFALIVQATVTALESGSYPLQ